MQDQSITQAAQDHKYVVKGLRTFMGMEECGGFNATLYRDGKKVAFIINEDTGGPFIWRWETRQEEERMKALCLTIPPEDYKVGDEVHQINCDGDIFIECLVRQIEEERYWKRKCKTKTCVTLHSQQEGQYIEFKTPYGPGIVNHVKEKYGSDLKEIINERFLPKVAV